MQMFFRKSPNVVATLAFDIKQVLRELINSPLPKILRKTGFLDHNDHIVLQDLNIVRRDFKFKIKFQFKV